MVEKYKLYYRTFLVIFWVASSFGFVSEELLPPLKGATSIVFLLCDVVLFVLGLVTLRQKGDVLTFISYLLLAVTSTILLNGESALNLLNGSRDFLGLILVAPVLRYFFTCKHSREFMASFDRQLYIWLCLQAVCITEQFLRYGANDHGGGTMGMGASGIASILIYLVSFYLISRRWDSSHFWRSLKENWKYIFLLYPSYLNETKLSFILLAAYFVLLIKFDRKLVLRAVFIIPVAIAGLCGISAIYFSVTNQDADKVLSKEFVEEYLYGGEDLDKLIDVGLMVQSGEIEVDPRDWWAVDIPRMAKLLLIGPYVADCPGGHALGAGLGHFKGGQLVKETHFAEQNRWLLQGSRPWSFFVYVQLGWVGFLWSLLVLGRLIFCRGSRYPQHRQIMILVSLAALAIMFYNDTFRVFNFCVTMFYITLALRYYQPEPAAEEDGSATDAKIE